MNTKDKRFLAACHALTGLLSQHVTFKKDQVDDEEWKTEPVYRPRFIDNMPPTMELVRDSFNIAEEMIRYDDTHKPQTL